MLRFAVFSVFLIPLCRGEHVDIVRFANDLSQFLDATTNIIYFSDSAPHIAAITKDLSIPKLIITRNITYNVKHILDKQILSVVLLADAPTLDHSWHSIVFSSLKRLHYTDVLFLCPREFTTETEIWLALFTLYWQHGFYKLLVVDVRGQLLTLEPFPQLSVVKITLDTYLRQRNGTKRDLKGHRLRISYAHDPSRTLIYRNPETGELQFDGAPAKIYAAFAKRYNATIEPLIAPHSADFNIDDVCRQRLNKRLVDLCSDWTVNRADAIISRPLQLYHYYLVVRCATPLSKLYYFQVPFQAAAWQAIGASICLVTLSIALLTRLQRGEWYFGRLGLDVWASFLYLAFNLRPLQTPLRSLLFLTLVISGFMLSNLYLGYLSSILGKSVYESQIKTLKDFQQSNLTIMTHENQYFALMQYGIPPILAERLHFVSYEEYTFHRNNFDTRYAYLTAEVPLIEYQQRFLRRPLMQKLERPITSILSAHALKKDWPLEKLFNKHSLEMFDAGLYKRFFAEADQETVRLGYVNYAKTERWQVRPLGLEYIAMPAVLLGCGYSFSFLALLLELLFVKMKKHRENVNTTTQTQK